MWASGCRATSPRAAARCSRRCPAGQLRALYPDCRRLRGPHRLRARTRMPSSSASSREARERGYATEDGEVTPGFASVAVSVRDHAGGRRPGSRSRFRARTFRRRSGMRWPRGCARRRRSCRGASGAADDAGTEAGASGGARLRGLSAGSDRQRLRVADENWSPTYGAEVRDARRNPSSRTARSPRAAAGRSPGGARRPRLRRPPPPRCQQRARQALTARILVHEHPLQFGVHRRIQVDDQRRDAERAPVASGRRRAVTPGFSSSLTSSR